MLIRNQHINLIRKIAWSFHHSTDIDWQELFSEASLAYCDALQSYNPAKGKVTTHLWNCMKSRLISFMKEEEKYHSPLLPLNGTEFYETPCYSFEYFPMITYNEKITYSIEKALQKEKNTRMMLKTKYQWNEFIVDQVIQDMKTLILLRDEKRN